MLKTVTLAIFIGLMTLTACQKSEIAGPVEVKWDRDACDRCKMALSDKQFAAQILNGKKGTYHKFDDLGCAVIWLEEQPWKDDPATKMWVKDYRFNDNAHWLDARTAYYVPAKNTPMDYGLGAVSEKMEGAMDFNAAKATILQREKSGHHHMGGM